MNILNFIKSNKKEIVIAFSFLFVGIIISPTPTEIIEKPVIKQVKKIEYSETCKPLELENKKLKKVNNIQRQVMSLDNEAILLGAQGLDYCNNMLKASSRFDADGIRYWTIRVKELTPKMLGVGIKKHRLLEQLESIK